MTMEPSTLAPGTPLKHYVIVSRLGAGGMGEVYRAHDEDLDRDVAIKVLPAHLEHDAEMHGRFEREARAAAALSHPNVTSIHELSSVDGVSFAVMELLEGESLRERIMRGPLPWRMAALFGAQAAEGLAAAHAKGIVHRDIKPENLFVLTDGWLKVLDFGLARWTPADKAGAMQTMAVLTPPHEFLGSMGYMAPEQVLGHAVRPSVDIFALGCVMYEMVTGKPAFTRETPDETIAAILRASPQPMNELVPGMPPMLEPIVVRCLAKDPATRFASATDLASALRLLLADSSISNIVPPRARKSRSPERSVAVLPFSYSGEPDVADLADGLTEAVINSLSQVPSLRVVPRSTAFECKARDLVTSVALALNVRSLVTGHVVKHAEAVTIQAELIDTATRAQVWGHQYRYALSNVTAFDAEVSEHIATALNVRSSREHVKQLRRRQTLDTEAYNEYLRGRLQWARWTADGITQSIEHFERAIKCDASFALGWSGLAEALIFAGYYAFADQTDALARGLWAARRAVDFDPALAEAHAAIGFALLFAEWDWRGAEAAMRRAVEINPHLAIGHAYLGLLLAARGRRDEAIIAAKRASTLQPFSLLVNQIQCWVLFHSGEYEAALTHAGQLLALDETFAEAHAVVILCNEVLGHLDKAAGQWAAGFPVFGQGHDRTARMKAAVETREATGYWEERAALAREIPDHLSGLAHLAQAWALAHLDRLDEAVTLLEELVTARHPQAVFLGAEPLAHAFQAHPGFEKLLERVGLFQAQGAR